MKRWWMMAAGMAAATPFVVGCGGDDGPPGNPKIALMAPKTGALSQVGGSFERVFEVAIGNINDLGGIDGRDLEYVIADTQTNAMTAGDKLLDLVNEEGVVAVVGPATSGEVGNAFPIAADLEVPIISPSSTAPSLTLETADNGFMFRNVPDDNMQAVAIARYLLQELEPPVTEAAVLFEDTDYGRGLKNAFKIAYEDGGGSVIADGEVGFTPTCNNDNECALTAEDAVVALTALGEVAPAMTVMVALEQDAITLAMTWDNGGTPLIPDMQFFMTDGARSQGFLDGAPVSVRGMCGTAPTYPTSEFSYTYLKDAYEAAEDDALESQVFAPNVWDATHLIAAALMQQKADGAEAWGGEQLRDAITSISKGGQTFNVGNWRDMVLQINGGGDVDYDGAAGPNDFDVNGQAVGPYEVWCVSEDGATFDRALYMEADELQ